MHVFCCCTMLFFFSFPLGRKREQCQLLIIFQKKTTQMQYSLNLNCNKCMPLFFFLCMHACFSSFGKGQKPNHRYFHSENTDKLGIVLNYNKICMHASFLCYCCYSINIFLFFFRQRRALRLIFSHSFSYRFSYRTGNIFKKQIPEIQRSLNIKCNKVHPYFIVVNIFII